MSDLFKYTLLFVGLALASIGAMVIVAEPRAEYEIDLINQDSVRIYSVENNKVYYTSPDSIVYILEIDNL